MQQNFSVFTISSNNATTIIRKLFDKSVFVEEIMTREIDFATNTNNMLKETRNKYGDSSQKQLNKVI